MRVELGGGFESEEYAKDFWDSGGKKRKQKKKGVRRGLQSEKGKNRGGKRKKIKKKT